MDMTMTPSLKPADVSKEWLLIDATDLPLGRLSSEVAKRLRGKHLPTFTPHVDSGANIVIINAEKVRLTGYKAQTQEFFWHTGYPGGIKSIILGKELSGKHPQRVIERAVKRMLPKTKLGRKQLTNLHVYAGSEHPHTAQKPVAFDMAAQIAKKTPRKKETN